MKILPIVACLAALWPPIVGMADAFTVERIFREPRLTRVQPIDNASWLWLPGDAGVLPQEDRWTATKGGNPDKSVTFLKFKKAFVATTAAT